MESYLWLIFVVVVPLLIVVAIIIRARIPGDSSKSAQQYYAGMKNPPSAAMRWSNRGKYFPWKSTLPANAAYGSLNIFYVCAGNPENPAIVLIHGYPTSSYDFYRLVDQLSNDYYLCTLDTPGYGFSDKPEHGYHYSIVDDARLVDDFVRHVVNLKISLWLLMTKVIVLA